VKLRWTRRARRDLVDIARYIERDKPDAARRWVARLRQRARAVVELPESGRRVPETARDDVREVLVRSYRIVYLIDAETVWILTVFEGHRMFPRKVIEELESE
jgi:toxin ParE1/3/4